MRLSETEVVARIEEITTRRLRLWVRNGWIAPALGEAGPVFDQTDVARIQLVCELKRDLSLQDDAVPVVLSLIDQVHGLRCELRALAEAVERLPDDAKARVRDAYRDPRND